MHSPISRFLMKTRIYRRRHKSMIYASIGLLIIIYFIFFQHIQFIHDSENNDNPVINVPTDQGSFNPFKALANSVSAIFSNKKTVPYKHTEAHNEISQVPKLERFRPGKQEIKPGKQEIKPGKQEIKPGKLETKEEKGKAGLKEDPIKPDYKDVKEEKEKEDEDEDVEVVKEVKETDTPKAVIKPKEKGTDDGKAKVADVEETKVKPTEKATKDSQLITDGSKYDKKRKRLAYQFYEQIFQVLDRGEPLIPELRLYPSKERIYHARYDSLEKDDLVFSESYLSKFLQLTPLELESMTEKHKYVIDNLPEKAPPGLYKGNGIVYVGGGKFNWLTLLSIKSLRAMGSKVAIEVLIPHIDEFEPHLCKKVFPDLGAKCIYLPNELNSGETHKDNSIYDNFEFKGYQYKALAILLSSFENVLLLDSDNIPVHRPDKLFTKNPFLDKGFIVWPDFWKRATSPHYYKIAGLSLSTLELLPRYNEVKGLYETANDIQVENLDNVPLHLRKGSISDPTSESGQLMISKKTHTKALLMALYYNLYGPSHFYPLFSQGSDGEGDKETFLAATIACGKPYYQVSKFLNAFGHFSIRGEFEGTGMGQYDPVEDFEYNKNRNKDGVNVKDREPQIFFVHANFPKLNPWQLKVTGKNMNEKAERIRLYGTGMKKRTGYDFETVQWTNMFELLCDMKIELEIYKDVDRAMLCREITAHLKFLHLTADTLE